MRSLILLALLAAAAPASAARTQPMPPASPLHGYVLGRYAYADDSLGDAARFFDAAREQDPGQPELRRRAFALAIASGDQARGFVLARQLAEAGEGDAEVSVVRLVEAVLKKDWRAAEVARAGMAQAGYASVVGPIVDGWILFGRGKPEAGLKMLDPTRFTGFARSYIAEQRAHMLAAAGRWPEAAQAYGELRASTAAGISFLRQGEADALAQAGDKAGALKLLEGGDGPMEAARARLAAGKRIGLLAPDARRGLGWMCARLAADLSRERPVPLAVLFARVSTFLAPDVAATWLIGGDVLARSGQQESALTAYGKVLVDDALADVALSRRADVLESMGRDADAGAILRTAAEAPAAGVGEWTRLGDWHRRAERFGDAAAAYSRAIMLDGEAEANWGLWFLRGSMKERGGDWKGAEADLRVALVRAPDEPIVLNYLGYSLLDRGVQIAEASSLIERAANLRPGDGGIVDSLGWSLYRQGRFGEAVETLERAAGLEPTDPTVTEHLGDAYWQVGRRIEARFRWRAALAMEPSDKQRKDIAAKLDFGLDAAPAMLAAK